MKRPCLPDATDLSKAMRNYARISLLLVTAKTHCPEHRHDNTLQLVLERPDSSLHPRRLRGEPPNDQASRSLRSGGYLLPKPGG